MNLIVPPPDVHEGCSLLASGTLFRILQRTDDPSVGFLAFRETEEMEWTRVPLPFVVLDSIVRALKSEPMMYTSDSATGGATFVGNYLAAAAMPMAGIIANLANGRMRA